MNITKVKQNIFLPHIKQDNKLYQCFCNNCGDKGNIYNTCNMPVTSVGIICYFFDESINDYKFLMIKRCDSLGYVDFIRGKYNLYNNNYIKNLVNEMTNSEKDILLNKEFPFLWKKLWKNSNDNIDNNSKSSFESIKIGINDSYNLESIIKGSTTDWKEPEWGFPKGRRNYQEKDYSAAVREFSEETGINTTDISILQNIRPFEECFIGSNFKCYKHKYYIAKLDNHPIDLSKFQRCEVSDIKFFTYKECIKHIRSYNKEKMEVIKNVYNLLRKYEFH